MISLFYLHPWDQKIKLAIGLLGFFKPTLAHLIALDTAFLLHPDQLVFDEEFLPY